MTLEAIPLERLVGPAVVIDVTDSAAANPDYRLTLAERFSRVISPRLPRTSPHK